MAFLEWLRGKCVGQREVTVTLRQSDSQKRATLINELDTMISQRRHRDWQSLWWAAFNTVFGIRTEFEFDFPLGLKVGECYSRSILIESVLYTHSQCMCALKWLGVIFIYIRYSLCSLNCFNQNIYTFKYLYKRSFHK